MRPIKSENALVQAAFREMDRQGVNRKVMARMIGVHPNTLGNWRQGHAKPSLIDIDLMAGALGMEFTLKPKAMA